MMASSLIIKLTDYWINNKTTSTVSVAQSFIIPEIILPVYTHKKNQVHHVEYLYIIILYYIYNWAAFFNQW